MSHRSYLAWFVSAALVLLPLVGSSQAGDAQPASYQEQILADQPLIYWDFSRAEPLKFADDEELTLQKAGRVDLSRPGPVPPYFPPFVKDNKGLHLDGGGYLRIADQTGKNRLAFRQGESLTIEAWVNPSEIRENGQVYVVGKGRTHNAGFPKENQNYALRLRGESGQVCLSFLFRSAGQDGKPGAFHRWNSKQRFSPASGWHHIAVSYTFGKPKSIQGYIDGKPTDGTWDFAGATDKAPVVDEDEVWIGSALGGNASSSFKGGIDEVAVYRRILPPQRIAQRFVRNDDAFEEYVPRQVEIPAGRVLVEIMEGIPAKKWDFLPPPASESFITTAMALVELPQKYSREALRVDRSDPFLVRISGRFAIPSGPQRVLVRGRCASRLYVDGKQILETPFPRYGGGAHNHVRETASEIAPNIPPLHPGDQERVTRMEGDGQEHLVQLELIVGGRKRRPEVGNLAVCVAAPGEDFRVLSNTRDIPLTIFGWDAFVSAARDEIQGFNTTARRKAAKQTEPYWKERHKAARRIADQQEIKVPQVSSDAVHNDIDRFINHALAEAKQSPQPLCDDWTFLRRVTLDVVGRVPTPEEIAAFQADPPEVRREKLIDRLLASPEWADHWVGYWQDVLAENPNILKPTLNNTGPFRWWIYESFLDNKPFDQFATELVRMRGSKYFGGPAGFAMATQNDAPLAAKAHIVGQAFLGLEMKCARCHDAPHHDFGQRDLFSVAAMLGRQAQTVPKTSSLQVKPEDRENLAVTISLKPGEKIAPTWPFAELVDPQTVADRDGMSDSRERLAALVTSPHNQRFPQVIANRLWRRYLGRGLVEPVDDWEFAEPSHPELLRYLSRELLKSGYDLKALARQILRSHTYQRELTQLPDEGEYLFAGPLRRRMSAEQLVDSCFSISGKDFDCEELNFDVDGRSDYTKFLNLGVPDRAWQMTSLSNERDRPSLAMPVAQSLVDTMQVFGWRDSRQSPLSVREGEPTLLQPAFVANGIMANRMCRLSEESRFTEMALAKQPLEAFVTRLYLAVLTRPPTDREREVAVGLLAEGYQDRVREGVQPKQYIPLRYRGGVSWSNHLSPEANRIKLEIERAVREGDPPTERLQADWRERVEDLLWALQNSPEFVLVP